MRKLLLWMGTMWVGMVTLIVVLFMFTGASSANGASGGSGSGGAIFGSVVLWLFSLAGGVALSAPAFLNPPDDNGGIWAFRLPLPLWLFLMMMKLTSWVGFYILLGTWMLIFKVWNTHQNNKLPTFSNQPQPAYATQPSYGGPQFPPQPQFTAGLPPASWQADPTGRYRHRWWDGMRWTDRVANGNVQAIDPL